MQAFILQKKLGSPPKQKILPSVQLSHSVVSDSLQPHGLAAHQASLSITNPWSLAKLMSIESVMPSEQLILCRPLLLLPSIFPSIRVFSNESAPSLRFLTTAIYSLFFEKTMQTTKHVTKVHPSPDNIHSYHNKLLKKKYVLERDSQANTLCMEKNIKSLFFKKNILVFS